VKKNIKKYMQKDKDEYSKQYSCIVKSSKSDKHAFCTICSADISISGILPYFGALSPFFILCRLASLNTLGQCILPLLDFVFKEYFFIDFHWLDQVANEWIAGRE